MLIKQLLYSFIVFYRAQHSFITQSSNNLPQITVYLGTIFICYLVVTYLSDLLTYIYANICKNDDRRLMWIPPKGCQSRY